MTQQWIRDCSLSAEGGGQSIELKAMRIHFEIKQNTLQSPNIGIFRVYNLSKGTVQRFMNMEFKVIEFQAGYVDNMGRIFKGMIKQTISGRENPTDTFLDILASDEFGYNEAVVNKTFAPGSTNDDHFQAAFQAFKPYGITLGYQMQLSKTKYPRSVSLFGMARDIMRTIAQNNGAKWSVQNGELQILGDKESLPNGQLVINAHTGMIGMPQQTQSGVMVKTLLNPAIRVNTLIKLDNASIQRARYDLGVSGQLGSNQGPGVGENAFYDMMIAADGVYRVLAVDWEGDTRGQPWYCNIACVAQDAAAPPSQTALGRS